MGVLNAVRYAHNASSSLIDQSFLEELTVFSSICFICLLETSTCPLVCGWYGVAILCLTLYFFSTLSINLFKKWVPSSLIKALGTPNLEKMLFFRKVTTTLASFVGSAIASTHLET